MQKIICRTVRGNFFCLFSLRFLVFARNPLLRYAFGGVNFFAHRSKGTKEESEIKDMVSERRLLCQRKIVGIGRL